MFPSIDLSVNLSILKHFNNDDFSSFRVNWNIFVFKLLHMLGRSFRFNLNWIRFVFLPNKIELIGSIEFDWFDWVRLSNSRFRLIELTEKVQFDNVRLPNQSNNSPTDWVQLSSIDFWFGFVRLATRDVFIGYSWKVSAHYKQALSLSRQSFCNFMS